MFVNFFCGKRKHRDFEFIGFSKEDKYSITLIKFDSASSIFSVLTFLEGLSMPSSNPETGPSLFLSFSARASLIYLSIQSLSLIYPEKYFIIYCESAAPTGSNFNSTIFL